MVTKMNKYDIYVHLQLPEYKTGIYTLKGVPPGGKLKGYLQVTPNEHFNCRRIWGEFGYYDKGVGTPNENRLESVILHEGEMLKGSTIKEGFSFQAPLIGPVSYEGEYVKIVWFLRIRVDIPFWFDDRREYNFKVIPRVVDSPERINFKPFEKGPPAVF